MEVFIWVTNDLIANLAESSALYQYTIVSLSYHTNKPDLEANTETMNSIYYIYILSLGKST